MRVPAAPEAPRHEFTAVTPAQWESLATRRIYFGHQSVGGNIADGIQEVLAAHPGIGLRLVEARTMDSAAGPGLYHARIGANGAPDSKAEEFAAIVGAGRPAVGALKYCYVDIDGDTDPDSLFARYQRHMAAVRERVPGLTVVHVTMPLTITGMGRSERLIRRIRGQATDLDLAAIRGRYNALLRQAYVGTEPVFDLARLESTRADGSRAYVVLGGDTVHVMADELTSDGGHLNAAGRRVAAEEFLALLAGL